MRIAIGIEYDGSGYNGWQRQTSGVGVQQRLEEALSRVADHPIEAVCAGRTDAGVHATGQVAHFDTHSDRTSRSWLLGTNSNLPDDICVSWARPVADDFHARYTATARRYEYRILNRLQRSALHRHRAWWVHEPLDARRMQDAASALIGEHDFSAYRAAGCQSRTAIREVTALDIVRDGDWLTISVTANAFLQHMVRNIVGTLAAIGRGDEAPGWAAEVLASRDRTRAGMAAPPQGLTLVAVTYPPGFGISVKMPP